MASAIRCQIERADQEAARGAVAWARRFYPDVTATFEADGVRLASDTRDKIALRLIWQSLLANEKILARSASCRAAVLEALVR